MFRFLLLVLAVSICTCQLQYPVNEESFRDLYRYWKLQHGKIYKHENEEKTIFKTFKQNIKLINNLNIMYKGTTGFALNQYADMTPEEFQQKVLMPGKPPQVFGKNRYINLDVNDPLPESFDWREKNMVTSVKDQGVAGTCWAFSAVGNLEGQWGMKGKQLQNFSVEQISDCDGSDCGMFGGWPSSAIDYVRTQGGLESWNDYSYCSGTADCIPCPAPGYSVKRCGPPQKYCHKNESCEARLNISKFIPELKVKGWQAVSQNEEELAHGLMKLGPLSTALDADLLMFYEFGVFNPRHCNPKVLNHAVLIVGFGVEKTISGDTPYWLIKNCWGDGWAEGGYFKIKRGSGTCGINRNVVSAILY